MVERVRAGKGAVVFLPSIPWSTELFQRPHHLARWFAREGYVAIFDCTCGGPIQDVVNGFKEIEPNLFLYRGRKGLLAKLPRATLWTFPYNFHLKGRYSPRFPTVYDWMDDLEVFSTWGPEFIEKNHWRAMSEATVIATVTKSLHAQAIQVRPDAVYLPNGVDYFHFALDAAIPNDPAIEVFRNQGKPIAGYYGAFSSWFNYPLLETVARLRPDWNFLLIGLELGSYLKGNPLLELPNVAWIGPRSYQALPGYLKLFDVAMIPFQVNRITKETSPLKLYEFFAGGKPTVTTPIPECRAYPEVHEAATAEEFSAALDLALKESKNGDFCERLRAIGRKNSWTDRVRKIAKPIADCQVEQAGQGNRPKDGFKGSLRGCSRLPATERTLKGIEAHHKGLGQPASQLPVEGKLHRFVRFLLRVRYWILFAPMPARIVRARKLVKQIGRRTGLVGPASWIAYELRKIQRKVSLRVHLMAANQVWKTSDSLPAGYDVICLPVIAWNSRFQRPQQLMQQYAEHGHRVFYASLDFHGGADAELSPLLPNVFEMALPGASGANVYRQLPSPEDVNRMASAIDRLRREHRIASALIAIQLPFWTALAETLREKFGWPIVYDCMDDHSGFSTNCEEMLSAEQRTIAEADLVVVTSGVLEEKVRAKARRTALVRNACDYEHFHSREPVGRMILDDGCWGGSCTATPGRQYNCRPNEYRSGSAGLLASPPSAKITVGFYGAIAEWFDGDLVADLAERRPDWRFELIGSTYTGEVSRLEKLPNVALLGEKPYAELPELTAGWNCFIVPFKRIPLTEATNPVKVYEMLATGKPVVAVNLPELRPMAQDGLLELADDGRGFADAIDRALAGDSGQKRQRRCAYAASNTWELRWRDFDAKARGLFPLASILIVTYNNLSLNKACLHSIFHETEYPNFEAIVVDNASSDGTPDWLVEAARLEPRLRVVVNRENRGYSAANNQALRIARGEFLCLLNNDTLVTRGWLSTLIGHLRKRPGLGIVGPVSNKVENDAVVPVGYKSIAKMPRWAERYCREHDGQSVPMQMLGFFCVLMPRKVYEQVGELDERFGIGYYEDDDYCRRVRDRGFELRFVRDAFVHHWHSSSFNLMSLDRRNAILYQNLKVFQDKWNPIDSSSFGKSSVPVDPAKIENSAASETFLHSPGKELRRAG